MSCPLVRFEDVTKRFGDRTVLDGVTFDVARGSTQVVLGRSGCGKSVLFKCLIGLLRPEGGRILFEGRDLVPLPEEDRVTVRARFGVVFQGAALFDSLTVAENVGFGLRRLGRPEEDVAGIVAERLAQVGLPRTGGQKPSELSGGMKKRVGLARALAMDPEVLLYDEPTTGLDPVTSDQINDLILATQRRLKVTSIVVTHDMASAWKIADRIVLLDRGRVRAEGTPDAIRRSAEPVVRRFIEGRADVPAAEAAA